MSAHLGILSAWKEINRLFVGSGGANKNVVGGWVGVGGAWKRFFSIVPDTMIAFFASSPSSPWKVLNGVDASPDVVTDELYLRCASAEGSVSGANTHTHATITGNTGTASPAIEKISDNDKDNSRGHPASHTHTADHGHVAAVNHEPPYIKLIPAVGGEYIPNGAILFFEGGTVPAGFSVYSSALNRFVKCSSAAGGTGGSTSHSHSDSLTTGYDNSYTHRQDSASGVDAGRRNNHAHDLTHTHNDADTNLPPWYGLIPIRANDDIFGVPSGICAWFTGSSVPTGWTQYSARDNDFIQSKSSSGGSGGAATHAHAHSGDTGDTSIGGVQHQGDSVLTAYVTHHHPIDGLPNHVDGISVPKHIGLLFCKKD